MEDLSKEELEQLLAVFRDQSIQLLDGMTDDLLLIESSGAEEDVMVRLRRAAHTLKGDSSCMGLEGVTELAHRMEDALDTMDPNGAPVSRALIDLLLDCADRMKTSINSDPIDDIPAEEMARLLDRLESVGVDTAPDVQVVGEVAKTDGALLLAAGRTRRDFVRVEASRLDALLNLAGEMVIARSVIGELTPELEQAFPRHELVGKFGGASAQMGRLIAELQKSVLKMRMTTIDQVFKRFARPIRELAAETGKVVNLQFHGADTELDRTLVDLLYEPLLHLLRNAVDHGIEKTEVRRAAGKPEAGTITLRAYHEGNQIVIEVSDDGCGINVDALKRRAAESGLFDGHDVESISDEDALDMIFRPGISTADTITRISGRGIGGSAIKEAVEQLRGSISVLNSPGAGAAFTLRMPLTLAIIRALLFRAGGQLLALPLLSVSEIVRAVDEEILNFDGFENYRLRDRFISLVRPGNALQFDRRKGGAGSGLREREFFVVVLALEGKQYGVVADSLVGEQELVIKPLESELVHNEALAGASVLGDGSVVLILDAGALLRKAVRHERTRGIGKVNHG